MRVYLIALTVLLAGVGAVALFYDWIVSFAFLPFALVLGRAIGFRLLFKTLLLPLIFIFMPKAWRYWIMDHVTRGVTRMRTICTAVFDLWNRSTWLVRAFLTIPIAIVAGSMAYAAMRVQVPFVGDFVKRRVTPILMRGAAARGLEAHMPHVLKKLPKRIREDYITHVRTPYMALWWQTARFGVREKRAYGRRAALVEKQRKELEFDLMKRDA